MPRVRSDDTPAYADDVVGRSKPIGSQLAGSTGLFTVLLVAMSAMESPLPRQDFVVEEKGDIERSLPDEPGLLCAISGTIVSWIDEQAS
jgi:hypothetical protein